MKKESLSKEEIIKKLESWCAYRERCESEVRQKLLLLQADAEDTEEYLAYLRENNFLNEERFAGAFARGKFNIKSWGKKKIEQELKAKRIDGQKIRESIAAIDEGMYFLRLQDILSRKLKTMKEQDPYKRKQKLLQYALQKGYESRLILEALRSLSL